MYSPYEDTKCVAQFLEPECVAKDTKCVTDVLCEDPHCVANYRYQIFAFFHDNMSNQLVRLFGNDTPLLVSPVVWIWQPKYPYKCPFLPIFSAIAYRHRQNKLTLKMGRSTAIKPSKIFGQIRWQTDAKICLHSLEASIIYMMLLILNQSFIYVPSQLKTLFTRTRMRCARTQNAFRGHEMLYAPAAWFHWTQEAAS